MSQLPESLEAFNKEFITIDGDPFQIKIELVPLSEIDNETRLQLQLKLSRDTLAQASLDVLNIKDTAKRLEKYVSCRYGGFDDQPDIDADDIPTPEYFDCGLRGSCPVEGKLCKHIRAEDGFLTPREIEIIKLISHDLADKEIADKLGISYHTATTHRTNIQHKIGANSKVGIATFAIQKNIT